MIIRNPCRPSECVPSGRPRPNGAQASMSQTKRSRISGCLYGTDPLHRMDFRLFGARNAICVLFALIHLGGPNSVGAVDTPGRIPWGPRVDPRGDRQGATQGTPRWTTLGTHTMDKYRLPNCLPPKQAFIYPAGPRGYPGLSPRLSPGWSAGGGGCLGPQEFLRKFLPRVFSVHRGQLGALGVSRG